MTEAARRGDDEPRAGSAAHDGFRLPGGLPAGSIVIGIPLVAIALTGLLVATRPPEGRAPVARAVVTAHLVFEDRPDGAVVVSREPGHAPVAVLAPGSNAFVRVTLAGLVRERRREHQGGHSVPFDLTRWSDGRLTLDDTATHRPIELASFGPDNEASFGRLLEAATAGPTEQGGL